LVKEFLNLFGADVILIPLKGIRRLTCFAKIAKVGLGTSHIHVVLSISKDLDGTAALNLGPSQRCRNTFSLPASAVRQIGARHLAALENLRVRYSAAVAIATRGQDGLGTGCHHFATPNSFAITFAAL